MHLTRRSTPCAVMCCTRDKSKITCGRYASLSSSRNSREKRRHSDKSSRLGNSFTITGCGGIILPATKLFERPLFHKTVTAQIIEGCRCSGRGRQIQAWSSKSEQRSQRVQNPPRHSVLERSEKTGGAQFDLELPFQMDKPAFLNHGIGNPQSGRHVRSGKNARPFHYRAAVNLTFALNGCTGSNYAAGFDACPCSQKTGAQDAHRRMDACTLGHPHTRLNFLCRWPRRAHAGQSALHQPPIIAGRRKPVYESGKFVGGRTGRQCRQPPADVAIVVEG